VADWRTGRLSQAMQSFRHILDLQPDYPNACYNLAALLHHYFQQHEESLAVLEQLFAHANPNHPKATAIFDGALKLCVQVQSSLAAKSHSAASEVVEELRIATEALTGHPVVMVVDPLQVNEWASHELVLHYGRKEHLIHCNRSYTNPARQHVIANQLMHIQLTARARHAGKAKIFALTRTSVQSLFSHFSQQMNNLRSQGRTEEAIQKTVSELGQNLLIEVYHCARNMIIESKLRQEFPELSAAQFLANWKLHQEAPRAAQYSDDESLMPRNLACAGLALNNVLSRLQDHLFGGTTAFAAECPNKDAFTLGAQLWEKWQAFDFPHSPGDESLLVDEFAQTLGLRQGYEWRPSLDPSGDAPA
jgi:tetratricopeptide (TPR) repeat protein